ncbi:hypothetical protein VN97_g8765 [Penicillium thymicola]|uniref:Uncharacterized protein n=1 Tax=Penicillium thymicola TaxID=293382 RepID=A0AAI9TC48_PENTH|nr:hypothetical protein VN97_g8765 [Penicillium thymicola]
MPTSEGVEYLSLRVYPGLLFCATLTNAELSSSGDTPPPLESQAPTVHDVIWTISMVPLAFVSGSQPAILDPMPIKGENINMRTEVSVTYNHGL